MTQAPPARPRGLGLLADITPLRLSRPYRRMWLGTLLSSIGSQLTTVAVGLQVYDLTGSTFSVGLVGLFSLGPLIVFGLYGGALVDRFDRRRVIITSSGGLFGIAVAFTAQALAGLENVWLMYVLVAVQSGFFAVNSPARMAILPRLLPPEMLPAANALSGLAGSVGMTMGPLLAGFWVAWFGFGGTYLTEVLLLGIALTTLVALPAMPPLGEIRRSGLASVLEGLNYLRTRPNVRMTFIVDLIAMIFAMPRVLFPALGAVVIGGGATTAGILGAGIAVGALLAGVFSGPVSRVRRQGLAVLTAITAWGASIVLFGVVVGLAGRTSEDASAHWLLWPAFVMLVFSGMADSVSAVFRSTILQTATPDHMRGRLQGVFIVVVAGGPRLGDLVVGSAADLTDESIAAIAGGLTCIVLVVLLGILQPRFRNYDARHPQA
ncbi:MFS transporter [Kineosporia succinea]|uniref:ENTS family enterobactin (Siderophore) exporter n=2 Tax=Kineosporia succinea TaxID=84632 RepID=A0ABT9P5N0_9ACTN|nr:MFS transporter [Kineosporia succinea]MDP9827988.1 ENTS family enterobactin (siderophore) exporter [Kineosporia succinea]